MVKPSIANFRSHTAILKSSSWCAAFYQNIYIKLNHIISTLTVSSDPTQDRSSDGAAGYSRCSALQPDCDTANHPSEWVCDIRWGMGWCKSSVTLNRRQNCVSQPDEHRTLSASTSSRSFLTVKCSREQSRLSLYSSLKVSTQTSKLTSQIPKNRNSINIF